MWATYNFLKQQKNYTTRWSHKAIEAELLKDLHPFLIAVIMEAFNTSNAACIFSVHLKFDLGERSSLKGYMILVSCPYLETWLTRPNQVKILLQVFRNFWWPYVLGTCDVKSVKERLM